MSFLEEKFPNASQFLSIYFNQDFSDEFNEPEEAVDKFIKGYISVDRLAVVKELHQIVKEYAEEQLDDLIFALGCYYMPRKHRGITMHVWLEQIIMQIEQSL